MKIIERVKLVCESKGVKQQYLVSRKVAASHTIKSVFAQLYLPNIEFLIKFLTLFPDISAEWLLLGNGGMYKDNIGKDVSHVERDSLAKEFEIDLRELKHKEELMNMDRELEILKTMLARKDDLLEAYRQADFVK